MNSRYEIPMLQVGDTIVSADCITEKFCCDLSVCRGICCIEGEAGAPVTVEEIAQIENALPAVKDKLSRAALKTIECQGVAYADADGDLVTSIINGRDCVFTCKENGGCCMCALERAHAEGKTDFVKPISCALYPIRVTRLSDGTLALNYHRWSVCDCARTLGKKLDIAVYEFLKQPLVRAFGKEWYEELETMVKELKKQHYFAGL